MAEKSTCLSWSSEEAEGSFFRVKSKCSSATRSMAEGIEQLIKIPLWTKCWKFGIPVRLTSNQFDHPWTKMCHFWGCKGPWRLFSLIGCFQPGKPDNKDCVLYPGSWGFGVRVNSEQYWSSQLDTRSRRDESQVSESHFGLWVSVSFSFFF